MHTPIEHLKSFIEVSNAVIIRSVSQCVSFISMPTSLEKFKETRNRYLAPNNFRRLIN